MTIKKTSKEWKDELFPNYEVIDYDGWDRANFNFSFCEEKINEEEFRERMLRCTIAIIRDIPEPPCLFHYQNMSK